MHRTDDDDVYVRICCYNIFTERLWGPNRMMRPCIEKIFLLNFGSRLSPWSNRFKATETKTISCENSWRNLLFCLYIERVRKRNETDSIPDIFLDVLTPASRIHKYNTRFVSKLNYFRPRVSNNLAKVSFKFSAFGLKCLPGDKFKKNGSPIF